MHTHAFLCFLCLSLCLCLRSDSLSDEEPARGTKQSVRVKVAKAYSSAAPGGAGNINRILLDVELSLPL